MSGRRPISGRISQAAQRPVVIEGFASSESQREPIEQQADREELDQAARWYRSDRHVASALDLIHHPSPSAESHQRGREELLVLILKMNGSDRENVNPKMVAQVFLFRWPIRRHKQRAALLHKSPRPARQIGKHLRSRPGAVRPRVAKSSPTARQVRNPSSSARGCRKDR